MMMICDRLVVNFNNFNAQRLNQSDLSENSRTLECIYI